LVTDPKTSEAYARKQCKEKTTVVIIGVKVPTDRLFSDLELFYPENYTGEDAKKVPWYKGTRQNQSCFYKGEISPSQIVSVNFITRLTKKTTL
jgi:hypothetical protein